MPLCEGSQPASNTWTDCKDNGYSPRVLLYSHWWVGDRLTYLGIPSPDKKQGTSLFLPMNAKQAVSSVLQLLFVVIMINHYVGH